MFHESTWSIHTCVNYFARLAHETVARMALSEPDEQGSVGQNGHSGTARPDSHESESWSMRSRSAYCKAKEHKNQQDTKNRTGYASCGVADCSHLLRASEGSEPISGASLHRLHSTVLSQEKSGDSVNARRLFEREKSKIQPCVSRSGQLHNNLFPSLGTKTDSTSIEQTDVGYSISLPVSTVSPSKGINSSIHQAVKMTRVSTLLSPIFHPLDLYPNRLPPSSLTAIIRSSSPRSWPSKPAPSSQTRSSHPAIFQIAIPVPNCSESSSGRTSAA